MEYQRYRFMHLNKGKIVPLDLQNQHRTSAMATEGARVNFGSVRRVMPDLE